MGDSEYHQQPFDQQQQQPRKTRTLGAQRDLSETLSRNNKGKATRVDENSKFHVGGDVTVLLDEVLNNMTRSILIYDAFSDCFTDYEVQCLAEVFKYNKTVIAINMSGVDIGDGSIALLCDNLLTSNVQLLDFTNTPLDDDAGRSLWALAHNNKNVRTIIVSDTLVSEELMDDIDLACVHNEHTYDLPDLVTIRPDRQKYCVANQFGACPNGPMMCPLSHDVVGSLQEYDCYDPNGPKKMTEYNERKEKIQKLKDVEAGATWSTAKRSAKDRKRKQRESKKRKKLRELARERGEEVETSSSEGCSTSNSDDEAGTGYNIRLDQVKEKLSATAGGGVAVPAPKPIGTPLPKKERRGQKQQSTSNSTSAAATPAPEVSTTLPPPVQEATPVTASLPPSNSTWVDWLPYLSLGVCLCVIGGVILTDGKGGTKKR